MTKNLFVDQKTCLKEKKKKKEYCSFQAKWTSEFVFVEKARSAVKITSMKRSNIKRHFDTHHASSAAKYPPGERKKLAIASEDVTGRSAAALCMSHTRDWNWDSFVSTLAIVRNGKSFTDGKYT